MKVWRTTLTPGAIRNCNINLKGSPFKLSAFTGGTSEAEAPARRLRVHFEPRPTVDMWVYGDKGLLTADGRKQHIEPFFAANGINDKSPAEIEITETAVGELRIRKV